MKLVGNSTVSSHVAILYRANISYFDYWFSNKRTWEFKTSLDWKEKINCTGLQVEICFHTHTQNAGNGKATLKVTCEYACQQKLCLHVKSALFTSIFTVKSAHTVQYVHHCVCAQGSPNRDPVTEKLFYATRSQKLHRLPWSQLLFRFD